MLKVFPIGVKNPQNNKVVNFKGRNIGKAGRKIIDSIEINPKHKRSKLLEGLIDSIKEGVRSVKNGNDLPYSEKPIILKLKNSSDYIKRADDLGIPVPSKARENPTVSNTTYIRKQIERREIEMAAEEKVKYELEEMARKEAEKAKKIAHKGRGGSTPTYDMSPAMQQVQQQAQMQNMFSGGGPNIEQLIIWEKHLKNK